MRTPWSSSTNYQHQEAVLELLDGLANLHGEVLPSVSHVKYLESPHYRMEDTENVADIAVTAALLKAGMIGDLVWICVHSTPNMN